MAHIILIYILCLVYSVTCSIHTPIPLLSEDPGLKIDSSSTGKVTLEAFLELLCPDSAAAWPILKDVAQHYGPQNINVVTHWTQLPYHRNAFLVTQGLYLVMDVAPASVFDYIDAMFANLSDFSETNTRDQTERQTLDYLADITEAATGIPKQTTIDTIYNYRSDTIRKWKFATLRGSAGTPWFHVNNINLATGGVWHSFEEWTALLDPLMS